MKYQLPALIALLLACLAPAQNLKTLTPITGANVVPGTDYIPMIDVSADGLKGLTIDELWKSLGGTNVSPTELGYLDGVTSSIQTQLDAKISSAGTAAAVTSIGNLTGVITSTNRATAIADGALSIAKTSGLQSALDAKITRAQTNIRLLKYKKALAKLRSGDKENLRVICIGDSTTSGYGSVIGAAGGTPGGSAGGYDNCVYNSYPDQLARLLTTKGIPAQQNGVLGKPSFPGYATTIANDDPRWSVGSGWSQSIWAAGLGGPGLGNNSTSSFVTFTPTGVTNRIEVFYTPFNTLTVDIGGSTLSTLTGTGTNTILTTSPISCASGTNTIRVRNSTTSVSILNGINAYNSANPSCSIIMAGSGGVSAYTCAFGTQDSGVGFMAMNGLVSRDLTILSLGLNDLNEARTPAVYLSSMTAIANSCLTAGGSLIIVAPFPGIFTAYADYPAYLTNLKTLSDSVGAVLIDPALYFGNGTSFASQGMQMADGVHPNKNGYAAIAEMIANVMAE